MECLCRRRYHRPKWRGEAIRIELFGNLRVTCGDQAITTVNTNRLHSLLAYLALHGEASREQLAFLLWPDSAESQARTNLRQLLHHLRRALPADCCPLASDNHTVQWQRGPACTVDVLEFEAALSDAAAARARADSAAERSALEGAARLYQDDLLPALYDNWLEAARDRYRGQLAHALSRLAHLAEEQSDYPSAILHAERLLALDALNESHHQLPPARPAPVRASNAPGRACNSAERQILPSRNAFRTAGMAN